MSDEQLLDTLKTKISSIKSGLKRGTEKELTVSSPRGGHLNLRSLVLSNVKLISKTIKSLMKKVPTATDTVKEEVDKAVLTALIIAVDELDKMFQDILGQGISLRM